MSIKLTEFDQFVNYLCSHYNANPLIYKQTLGNILSIRKVSNKAHGDFLEIGFNEFFNQYLDDKYESEHVGKIRYRAKNSEEDLSIRSKKTNNKILASLKAYGQCSGYLQLSTDKEGVLFPYLTKTVGKRSITDKQKIAKIFDSPAFNLFNNLNVIATIYNEEPDIIKKSRKPPRKNNFNIVSFDFNLAKENVAEIKFIQKQKHPVYEFYDKDGGYIFEVRYGAKAENGLQRGLWTGISEKDNSWKYLKSITNGWNDYNVSDSFIKLLSLQLLGFETSHEKSILQYQKDIADQKSRMVI